MTQLANYRRKEQIVAARQVNIDAFLTDGVPAGVVQGTEGFNFDVPHEPKGLPVFDGHWLIYDELGTPQNVCPPETFERLYEPFDPQQPSPAIQLEEAKAELAAAHRVMTQMREQIIKLSKDADERDRTIYTLRRVIASVLRIQPEHERQDEARVIKLDGAMVARLIQHAGE